MREPGRRSSAGPIASISASSPMPVDDPRAVEVIRRHLDPHPIPRQDPDAEASHLARDVPEDDVAVVELHPEHCVRERLDDLAFELDLLFLGQLDDPYVRRLGALTGLTQLVLDLRALRERAETVTRNTREVHEGVLPPVTRSDEPGALLVAESLHDTSCHKQRLLTLTLLCARWCCRALPSRMLKPPDGRADAWFIPGVAPGSTGGRGRPAVLVAAVLVAGRRRRALRGRLVEVRVELALAVSVALAVAVVRLLLGVGSGRRRRGRRGRGR